MILEITLGTLALAAYLKQRSKAKAQIDVPPHVQANRDSIFDTAINSVKDAGKLRELSAAFRSQGMDIQANMLEARAKLAEASPEVKAQRREVYRKAMESRDRNAVLGVATAFDNMGATGAANSLRTYADGLAASNIEIGAETQA